MTQGRHKREGWRTEEEGVTKKPLAEEGELNSNAAEAKQDKDVACPIRFDKMKIDGRCSQRTIYWQVEKQWQQVWLMPKFGGDKEESTMVVTSDTESKPFCVYQVQREMDMSKCWWEGGSGEGEVEDRGLWEGGLQRPAERCHRKGTPCSAAGGRRGRMIDVITVRCAGRRAGIWGSSWQLLILLWRKKSALYLLKENEQVT